MKYQYRLADIEEGLEGSSDYIKLLISLAIIERLETINESLIKLTGNVSAIRSK